MTVANYDELAAHRGHEIECVTYAEENAALECVSCGEVLFDLQKEEHEHEWGPVEVSRFARNPHRRCQTDGCKDITLDLDDNEEESYD